MNKAFHLLLSDCWILRRICAWRLECRSWCSGVLWDVQTTGTGSSSEIFIIRMRNWLIPKSLHDARSDSDPGSMRPGRHWAVFVLRWHTLTGWGNQCRLGVLDLQRCLGRSFVTSDIHLNVKIQSFQVEYCTVVISEMLFPLTVTGLNVVVSDQCKLMQEPFGTVRRYSSYERNWYRHKAAHNGVLRSV